MRNRHSYGHASIYVVSILYYCSESENICLFINSQQNSYDFTIYWHPIDTIHKNFFIFKINVEYQVWIRFNVIAEV